MIIINYYYGCFPGNCGLGLDFNLANILQYSTYCDGRSQVTNWDVLPPWPFFVPPFLASSGCRVAFYAAAAKPRALRPVLSMPPGVRPFTAEHRWTSNPRSDYMVLYDDYNDILLMIDYMIDYNDYLLYDDYMICDI